MCSAEQNAFYNGFVEYVIMSKANLLIVCESIRFETKGHNIATVKRMLLGFVMLIMKLYLKISQNIIWLGLRDQSKMY